MTNRVSTLVVFGLSCCSMQALPNPPAAVLPPSRVQALIDLLPQLKQYDAAQPKDWKGLPYPRACYLGGDCLAMDSHPFEVCQLSTTRSCGDKLAEVLQVEQPKSVAKPAPPLQRTSR